MATQLFDKVLVMYLVSQLTMWHFCSMNNNPNSYWPLGSQVLIAWLKYLSINLFHMLRAWVDTCMYKTCNKAVSTEADETSEDIVSTLKQLPHKTRPENEVNCGGNNSEFKKTFLNLDGRHWKLFSCGNVYMLKNVSVFMEFSVLGGFSFFTHSKTAFLHTHW